MEYLRMLVHLTLLAGLAFGCTPGGDRARTRGVATTRQAGLPNYHVYALAQDDLGCVWVATANGLCRRLGADYEVFHCEPADSTTIPSNNITDVVYRDSTLYVSTGHGVATKHIRRSGFDRYRMPDSSMDNSFSGFVEFRDTLYACGLNGIYKMDEHTLTLRPRWSQQFDIVKLAVKSTNGEQLWLLSGQEIVCLDANFTEVKRIPTNAVQDITAMAAYNNGLLLGTNNGLLTLDPVTYALAALPAARAVEGVAINTIMPLDDEAATVLLGTCGRGAVLLDLRSGATSRRLRNYNFQNLASNDITVFFFDNAKNLWLGSFDKGIMLLSGKVEAFNSDNLLYEAFKDKFVTRIAEDRDGNLWVGTRYEGLFIYNPATSTATAAAQLPQGRFIQEMFFDSSGRLWTCANDNLVVGSVAASRLTVLMTVSHIGNVVTAAEDSRRRVWLGTSDGGVYIYSPDLRLVRHIVNSQFQSNNITSLLAMADGKMVCASYPDDIYVIDPDTYTTEKLDSRYQHHWLRAIDLYLTNNGEDLWIGTYDNGLFAYNLRSQSLKRLDSFKSRDIIAIAEDSSHNIWISSSVGLYCVDAATMNVRSYVAGSGISGSQYHEKCACTDRHGFIYFGGNNGVQQINPANASRPMAPVKVCLTGISTIDKQQPRGAAGIDPTFLENVELSHNANSLAISFTGLDYFHPVDYAYMLEGFDKMWINSGENGTAVYSNLPHGNYTFLVKTHAGNHWSEPTRLVDIYVDVTPWLHPAAKVAYAILALVVLIAIIRLYIRAKLEKDQLALAEKRVEDERALNLKKVNFFNNISHEIRTPITLICSPVKQLRHNIHSMDRGQVDTALEYIDKNIDRILRLTNQILSFREIDGETLPLAVGPCNPVEQVKSIVSFYKIYAAEKKLDIDFSYDTDTTIIYYDSDKLDKILNNLLYNAVKYTSDNGHIKLRLDLTRHPEVYGCEMPYTYMELSVIDDGAGLPVDNGTNIFTRFVRRIHPFASGRVPGYGIGLNYVKELVRVHHGVVIGRNNIARGMTFIVAIPVERAAYTAAELAPVAEADATPAHAADVAADVASAPVLDMAPPEPDTKRRKILIVEDQPDILDFIASVVGASSEILRAENGLAGFETAFNALPDLIITDVKMPVIDGIEMLKRIKQTKETSHIPVIVLTAKCSDDDQIVGYRNYANLYIGKPFNPDILRSAVDSVLANMDMQKQILAVSAGSVEIPTDTPMLSPMDHKFLSKLYAYINENLSNTELNVNTLGRELGFSRTNFYRKIKAITGMTPNDLLRVSRLNRAAELLRERQYSIGEIADMTGFGTQSHFSLLFKQQFGVSPRHYPTTPRP